MESNTDLILIVEDDPRDEELVRLALEKNSIQNPVMVVRDGVECLDFLFSRGTHAGHTLGMPRIVLLDLHLPRLNGFDVLREIRANALTKGLPVVILTTSVEYEDLVCGYDLGVNSYVRKPVNFDSFIDTVGQLGEYWLSLNQPPPLAHASRP